jgi:hypothetical protein
MKRRLVWLLKKKFWRYGIGLLIIGIGVYIIWWRRYIDRIEPVYQWFQSLNEENIKVVSWEERILSSDERSELIKLLHAIPKKDIKLADVQGDMGNGSDYCIYITVDNETYQLWHTFIVMADVMIKYEDYDYWIQAKELKKFLEKTDNLDRIQNRENSNEEEK